LEEDGFVEVVDDDDELLELESDDDDDDEESDEPLELDAGVELEVDELLPLDFEDEPLLSEPPVLPLRA